MEFFDKLGKKASEAYKMTADKTGKIAKETKMEEFLIILRRDLCENTFENFSDIKGISLVLPNDAERVWPSYMREYSSCDILGETGIEILKNSRNASERTRRGLAFLRFS